MPKQGSTHHSPLTLVLTNPHWQKSRIWNQRQRQRQHQTRRQRQRGGDERDGGESTPARLCWGSKQHPKTGKTLAIFAGAICVCTGVVCVTCLSVPGSMLVSVSVSVPVSVSVSVSVYVSVSVSVSVSESLSSAFPCLPF